MAHAMSGVSPVSNTNPDKQVPIFLDRKDNHTLNLNHKVIHSPSVPLFWLNLLPLFLRIDEQNKSSPIKKNKESSSAKLTVTNKLPLFSSLTHYNRSVTVTIIELHIHHRPQICSMMYIVRLMSYSQVIFWWSQPALDDWWAVGVGKQWMMDSE